jgi:hypothetical protein
MKSKVITLSLMAVVAIASIGVRPSYDIRSAKKLAGGGRNVSFDIRSAKKAFVA